MTSLVSTSTQPNLSRRFNTFLHALAFVLGFSLVYIIVWGGAATLLGQIFIRYKTIICLLGGLVVIAFGLVTLGVLKISWLSYDTRPEWNPTGITAWLRLA